MNLGLRELFFSGLAAGFAIEMLSNLERAMEHEDRTPELAEILSTQKVRLNYRIEADLVINGDER